MAWFLSKPLPAGVPAPDFSLPDESVQEVRLSSLRGRNVVLVFYPGDETPVCRRQLCAFRDHWSKLQARDVVVLGVNPQSAESHARFRSKHAFPFPLLVDRGRQVAALYSAKGLLVKRTVYLIGKDGRIRFARRGSPPVEEVLAAAE